MLWILFLKSVFLELSLWGFHLNKIIIWHSLKELFYLIRRNIDVWWADLSIFMVTHPELSYSVHVLAQFIQQPREEHWQDALRVVSFLKGNLE